MSAWSPERIALLKKLWIEDGLSASQIAKQLGGITRCAVIGKVHRLGFQRSKAASIVEIRVRLPKAPPRAPRAKSSAYQGPVQTSPIPFKMRPEPVLRSVPILLDPVGLLDLNGGCKFAVSEVDGEHRFCGAHKAHDGPFCADHARIAYLPRTKARRASDAAHERMLRRFL